VILVCAATGTEAGACRGGIEDAGARGFDVLTTGVGPERSRAALARRLRAGGPPGPPSLIVSSGFAGALTAGIDALSWVTASVIHRLAGGRAVPVGLPSGLLRVARDATACEVVSADRALADDVSGLGGPAAVDMESAALAEVASEARIAFLVLRLVTDTPAHRLAPLGRRLADALSARTVAGRAVHGARAALEGARSPVQALAFVRESLVWRERLRAGWREHARRGLPSAPAAQLPREAPDQGRGSQ
jgi:hypothetical protein